jgi:hypothetical protein
MADFNIGGLFTCFTAGSENFTYPLDSNIGSASQGAHTGSGTCDGVTGVRGYASKNGTGVVAGAYGGRFAVQNADATGAITFGAGLFVETPTITGAITTYYGLYLAAGAGSTICGIAQVGSSDLNFFAGKSAFGSISPVATTFALFGASTAAISSQRILRGSAAYTGTVEGDFWNDFTQHCLTGYIAGVKQFDSRVLFVQTADKTVTNTNAETTLFGTGIGTLTLPANFFVVGKSLRITLRGRHTIDATPPNFTIRLKLGAVTLASHVHTDLNDTDQYWEINFILTCRTTGAGGTVIGQGYQLESETTAGDSNSFEPMVMTATAAMDTTAALTLDVTIHPDVADAGSSHTTTNALVEVIA